MSDDVLITPGSRKIEFIDSTDTVDAKIETDSSGNLVITNAGGDISLGDATADIFIGDGVNNVDIVFEQDGEIRGTTGVTVTLGASGSNVRMATDLNLNSNDITNVNDLTVAGNLTVQGTTTTLETATLNVEDKNITLNYGSGDTSGSADGAGITIQDAVNSTTDATFNWNATNDRWEISHGLNFQDNDFILWGGNAILQHTGTYTYIGDNSSGSALRITGGNLGIGTNPVSSLDLGTGNAVGDGLSFGSTSTELRRANSGNNLQMAHWGSVSMIIDSDGNDTTRFFNIMHGTNDSATATELFRVQENGNVGIGTTSPAYKLDVAGEIRSSSRLWLSTIDAVSISGSDLRIGYSNNNLLFRTNSGERMRITSAGNVGIGITNPSYKLVVSNGGASGIEFGPAYSGTANLIQSYNRSGAAYVNTVYDADTHRFNISGSEKVRIDSSGNLGIGTTSPGQLLDVDGTARFGTSTYRITLQGNSSGGYFKIGTTSNDDSLANFGTFSSSFVLDTTQPNGFVFRHSGAEKMRLNSSGNLGIGTTNPSSHKLQVVGISKLSSIVHKSGTLVITTASGDNYIGTIETSGNGDGSGATLTIYDGHRKTTRIIYIAIQNGSGTNSLDYSVKGSGGSTEVDIQLKYINRSGAANKTDFYLASSGGKSYTQIYSWEAEGLIEDTGHSSTGATTIDLDDDISIMTLSNGNAGIGTTSPDTTLDVTTGGVAGIILNQDTTNSAVSSRLFFKDSTRTNAIINVNGNLELRTGATIGLSSGTQRLAINGSSGAVTFNQAYTFPTADGSANQVLQTDGSGNLTFVSRGGAVDSIANFANNRVITASDADSLNGEANLTFDGSSLNVIGNIAINSVNFADESTNGAYHQLRDPTGRIAIFLGGSDTGNYHDNDNHYLRTRASSNLVQVNSNGLYLHAGSYRVGTTIVIDSSRNLTNIGTGSFSGKVTLSGTTDEILTLNSTDDSAVYMSFERGFDRHAYVGFGGGSDQFTIMNEESGGSIQLGTAGTTALTLDASQNATFAGTISSGNINIGTADTTQGTLTIHGDGTGSNEGGELRLATAADYDSTYDFYRLDVYQDDFRLGRAGTTDLFIFQNGNVRVANSFEVGNQVVIDSSRNLVNIGTISSGAITSSSTIKAQAHSAWNVDSGLTPYFEDDAIQLTKTGSNYLVAEYGNKTYSDAIIEAEFRTTNSTHFGIFFFGQATDPKNNSYNVILRSTDTVRLQTRISSTQAYPTGFGGSTGTATGIAVDDGNWHSVKATISGTRCVVEVDGTPILDGTMPTTYTSGTVGLIIYDNTAYFRNFQVRETTSAQIIHNRLITATGYYGSDDAYLDLHNPTGNASGTLLTADNGNTWLNADGGKDLWLNWYSKNSPSSYADLAVGTGNGGSAILFVDGSANRVGILDTSPSYSLDVNGTGRFTGNVTFDSDINFGDNDKAKFGGSNDLKIFHDGSNSIITQDGTGDLYIRNTTDDKDVILQSDDGSGGQTEYIRLDGSATEIDISQNVKIPDNKAIYFGTGNDFNIYHNGSHSYMDHIGTGNLYIRNTTDDSDIVFVTDDESGGITEYFRVDGSIGDVVFTKPILAVDINLTGSIQNTSVPAEASVKINENGYADGTTYFRDLDIFDGKTNQYVKFDGSTQRVGIGTTVPEEKLQVEGNIRIHGGTGGKGSRLDFGDEFRVLEYTTNDTLALKSPENMVFIIDNNNNETDKIFHWKANTNDADTGGTSLMTLNESGQLGIGTISSGQITSTSSVFATQFKSTSQTGQIWEAPAIHGSNTAKHQMRSRWDGDNDRWFLVPYPQGSADFTKELFFNFGTSQWTIEGSPSVLASGLHGTPNISVGTINSGAITSTGKITSTTGDAFYGLSTGIGLELGVDGSKGGAIKLHGTTAGNYALIQATTNNLHIDAVANGMYLNWYDGEFVLIGAGNGSTERFRFTSTGNFQVGGQTVIDASRNITTSGVVTINSAGAKNALVLSGTSPTIALTDTTSGHDNFWIHVNSNKFYILPDRDGSTGAYGQWETPYALELDSSTNVGQCFGNDILVDGANISVGTISSGDITVNDRLNSSGDNDTYLQFHAADQFRVVTGGSERLEVNTSETKLTAGNLNVISGQYLVNGQAVITNARALTNIASISADGSAKSVFANTSSSTIDLSGGTSGALQIGTGSSTVFATIAGRQTNTTQSGLGFYSATADGNTSTVGDMHFNVRENNNSTFATLTKKAFVWTHYTSELMHLTRAGNLSVTGDVIAFQSSDERLKTNLVKIDSALNKVTQISGYHFDWKDMDEAPHQGKDIGVIAQEIEKVLPEIVSERDTGYKAVNYQKLTALLIEAIKEQQEEIEQLKKHSHPAKDMCDMKGYEELVARIEKMEKNYGNN